MIVSYVDHARMLFEEERDSHAGKYKRSEGMHNTTDQPDLPSERSVAMEIDLEEGAKPVVSQYSSYHLSKWTS